MAVVAAASATHLLNLATAAHANLFLFFAAIVVSAWYAGRGPGWLAVALSAAAVDYFFFWSPNSMDWPTIGHVSWLIAFIACAMATNMVSLRRRYMEDMLRRHRDELDARVRIRTVELQQRNEELAAEVADRARAEASLRETQNELARASRALTAAELTASIAHEINQPLAASVTNGEAALNWLKRTPPDFVKARESITASVASAERASEIIGGMRLLMSGARPFHVVADVNALIDEVLLLARSELFRKNVAIRRKAQDRLPVIVGDPIQLQQLILNLVNNAIDSFDDVSDRMREIIITSDTTDRGALRIAVEDNGEGFDEADTNRIFKPFYSTKREGMGIGLSICRTIAQVHGGTINARLRRPHGAVFEIELPARRRHD